MLYATSFLPEALALNRNRDILPLIGSHLQHT